MATFVKFNCNTLENELKVKIPKYIWQDAKDLTTYPPTYVIVKME